MAKADRPPVGSPGAVATPGQGSLVLLGAPLGNPADASPRLRAELAGADVIAAEDTRRLRRLAHDLDVMITATRSLRETSFLVRLSWWPRRSTVPASR